MLWLFGVSLYKLYNMDLGFKHSYFYMQEPLEPWLHLTNDQSAFIGEYMGGYFQIQGSGTFADTARGIVVRAVTGTIVATEITGVGNWYTTQMCAYTNDN